MKKRKEAIKVLEKMVIFLKIGVGKSIKGQNRKGKDWLI